MCFDTYQQRFVQNVCNHTQLTDVECDDAVLLRQLIGENPLFTGCQSKSRGVFVQSLMEHFSHSNRFVAPSDQPNSLLVSSHPLKILTSTVQSILQAADIRLVDVMCFGTKAIAPLFGFLDRIVTAPQLPIWAVPNYDPQVTVDVGFSVEGTGVAVVRIPRHDRLPAGTSKTYAVRTRTGELTSMSTTCSVPICGTVRP